jgi:hypothetical protein
MFRWVILAITLFFVSVCLAGAFEVPDTGITECFDANGYPIVPCPAPGEDYFGQDGNLIQQRSMNYTDNADGTLTDTVTGLLWQKTADGTARTWDDAGAYCANLALGSHSFGWRLPVLVELNTLLDLSVDTEADPTTVAVNPLFTGANGAVVYWTATEDAGNLVNGTDNAWILNFNLAEDDVAAKSSPNYTRCVWEVTP